MAVSGHDSSHATPSGADTSTPSQWQPQTSRSLQSWTSEHGPRSSGPVYGVAEPDGATGDAADPEGGAGEPAGGGVLEHAISNTRTASRIPASSLGNRTTATRSPDGELTTWDSVVACQSP